MKINHIYGNVLKINFIKVIKIRDYGKVGICEKYDQLETILIRRV